MDYFFRVIMIHSVKDNSIQLEGFQCFHVFPRIDQNNIIIKCSEHLKQISVKSRLNLIKLLGAFLGV